jgi:hypothetical protein
MSQRTIIETFPQVDHHQASGALAELYDDIHSTLRVPWVAFAIRVMSQFEHFLPAAWAALKPQISTRYAEEGADKVREAAIIPGPTPADPTPALRASGWTEGEIAKLKRTLDGLNYGNPKYLILISAWNEAWHGRDAGGRSGKPLDSAQSERLPYGLPQGVEKFHLVQPDAAGETVQILLRDIRDAFLHHGPASDYRVLAAWPDYLEMAFRDALKPVALTAEYEETTRRIRKIAREHVRGFDAAGGVAWRDLTNQLTPEQIAGLTGLLFMYNRFIADMTVAIIRLKQAFNGAKDATENKFAI